MSLRHREPERHSIQIICSAAQSNLTVNWWLIVLVVCASRGCFISFKHPVSFPFKLSQTESAWSLLKFEPVRLSQLQLSSFDKLHLSHILFLNSPRVAYFSNIHSSSLRRLNVRLFLQVKSTLSGGFHKAWECLFPPAVDYVAMTWKSLQWDQRWQATLKLLCSPSKPQQGAGLWAVPPAGRGSGLSNPENPHDDRAMLYSPHSLAKRWAAWIELWLYPGFEGNIKG